ncbi:PQQ-binding-like beta-propeller repeat protein [Streptomyces cyaneofuscatus]|uniref:outer membrane protein assembly factor BamB family protein n=1 Tax=Streptomyces cyaneofuscatus TaxID=66883 RepID=UPI0036D7CA72
MAKESPGPASSAPASSAPPPGAPAARTPQPQRIPTTAEIDAARKPGDATAWIVDDRTDLPKGNHRAHDLWTVDGAVVQALHRKVAAYRLSDGAELWSVPLPTAVCETPANPAPDGKVVIVRQERPDDERGNRCNQLQMIDLKSGKQGWHKQLPETGSGDNSFIVYSAISGGTFAIARSMKATAYRVADGSELYDIPWENPGKCYPDDVAGGTRLLVSSDCAISMDRSKNYSQAPRDRPAHRQGPVAPPDLPRPAVRQPDLGRSGRLHHRERRRHHVRLAGRRPRPEGEAPHHHRPAGEGVRALRRKRVRR